VSTADGSLWFTHNQEAPPWNTQVGQMDLTGTVINLWSYPQGKMGGAAVGPDGSPWFTDAINDWVLRL
jgi:streptogramin lyase